VHFSNKYLKNFPKKCDLLFIINENVFIKYLESVTTLFLELIHSIQKHKRAIRWLPSKVFKVSVFTPEGTGHFVAERCNLLDENTFSSCCVIDE